MDPYLEHPALWPDVHNALIAATRDLIAPTLRPRYYVRLEERVYADEPDFVGRHDFAGPVRHGPSGQFRTVTIPEVERVLETYLEVHAVDEGQVVTVLELLSPGNKRPGDGRRMYEEKRLRILGTRTNLVEVDLLRAGEPMTVYGATRTSDYRILVSRGERRPRADFFVFSVRDPIPRFALPLRRGDDEPLVDLGKVLHDLYDRAAYDLSIDYRQEPVPPLREEDRIWARETSAKTRTDA